MSSMIGYEIGDRVVCVIGGARGNDYIFKGLTGTVVDNVGIGAAFKQIGVEWDCNVYGHDINGKAKDGFGWYVSIDDVQPFIDESAEDYEYTEDDVMEFLYI